MTYEVLKLFRKLPSLKGLDRMIWKEFNILRISPSDTGSKEDRAWWLLLGLVRETGTDDCIATLIFIILSLKKMSKSFD